MSNKCFLLIIIFNNFGMKKIEKNVKIEKNLEVDKKNYEILLDELIKNNFDNLCKENTTKKSFLKNEHFSSS